MNFRFVLILLLICAINGNNHHGNHKEFLYDTRNSSCQLKYDEINRNFIDVYWINLETSVDRKIMMQNYLQYYGLHSNYPIRAITPSNIVIPSELSRPQGCKAMTKNQTIAKVQEIKQQQQLQQLSSPSSPTNRTILLTGHCGRPKNSIKELAVTLSHLTAIYKAIHSNHKNHQQEHILILEDDLQLAIEINFQELLQHEQLPKDFIILQLVTSNYYIIQHLLKYYTNKRQLFLKRKENDDYWCAGAYIIHKKRFSQLFTSSHTIMNKRYDKLYTANIIAGYYRHTCVPDFCCNKTISNSTTPSSSSSSSFMTNYDGPTPCIKSSRGYQADNYIFALALEHTYILTIPLFVNTKVGNISTLHQEHVSVHFLAFNQTKQIIKDLFVDSSSSSSDILRFVNRHCVLNFTSDVII